jgi:tetratricopeptide (TPR) repeat protein
MLSTLAVLVSLASAGALRAQAGPAAPPSPLQVAMRPAVQLDLAGRTTEARSIFEKLMDTTTTPADKAQLHRAIAMSYAFDGNCAQTVAHELPVIDYWKTREQAEPQNAFYQEGEIADEAARVCIDAGDLPTAEKWYRAGYAYGTAEPAPKTHPTSLWDFRLANALGRLAARRGDAAEAHRQIAAARRALDSDSAMAAQQERFFPYLVGYVALYTNDFPTAEAQLKQALGMRGNENDPFLWYLLGLTYTKEGRTTDAASANAKAYSLARAHNPPSAAVRRALRGMVAGS